MIAQEHLDDIRAKHRVSDAVRRRTKLRRAGREWKGLCPFHSERTPSFTVNDAKGFYHCFGCGAHGDIIRFVQESERVRFTDAVAMLNGGALPLVDPSEMAKAREEDARADAEAVRDAQRFWDEAEPIADTPANSYLNSRKIFVRPDTLRFGMVPTWKNPDSGLWNAPRPCLMLRAESLAGEFRGLQRIFLTADGRKADMAKPKLSLGSVRGASIRFGHVRPEAILTGGPEDGLTLYQRFVEMVTVYVSCGEAMLPFIELPSMTRAVRIYRQNDAPGRRAARRCDEEYKAQGRRVYHYAPAAQFKDWNEEHCAAHEGASW